VLAGVRLVRGTKKRVKTTNHSRRESSYPDVMQHTATERERYILCSKRELSALVVRGEGRWRQSLEEAQLSFQSNT